MSQAARSQQTRTSRLKFRSAKGDLGDEDKDEMLDLVNRVQMFRIAIKKINNKLSVSGRTPVF